MKPRALQASNLQARTVGETPTRTRRAPSDIEKLRRDMAEWHKQQRARRTALGIEEPPSDRLDLNALRAGRYGRGK